jgi:hypothetical protein
MALSAAGYRYSQSQFLPESPPVLAQKIGEIQDIEHLRKVALFLARDIDRGVRHTNETISSGFRAIAALSFCFAFFSIVNWFSILKYRRILDGRPAKWLRWL